MPRDRNPKLTRDYAERKRVAEIQYRDPERAMRDGYQYENGEKNHHKRGQAVDTDQLTLAWVRRTNDVSRNGKNVKGK